VISPGGDLDRHVVARAGNLQGGAQILLAHHRVGGQPRQDVGGRRIRAPPRNTQICNPGEDRIYDGYRITHR
jgi:hypothetical protein